MLPTSDTFWMTVTAIAANLNLYPLALPLTPHEFRQLSHAIPSLNLPKLTPGFAKDLYGGEMDDERDVSSPPILQVTAYERTKHDDTGMDGWIHVLDMYKMNAIDGDMEETVTIRVATQCNDLVLHSQVQPGMFLELRCFHVLGETLGPLNIALLLTNFSVKGFTPLEQEHYRDHQSDLL